MQNYVKISENSVKNLEILLNISRVFCKLVDLGSLMYVSCGNAHLLRRRLYTLVLVWASLAGAFIYLVYRKLPIVLVAGCRNQWHPTSLVDWFCPRFVTKRARFRLCALLIAGLGYIILSYVPRGVLLLGTQQLSSKPT